MCKVGIISLKAATVALTICLASHQLEKGVLIFSTYLSWSRDPIIEKPVSTLMTPSLATGYPVLFFGHEYFQQIQKVGTVCDTETSPYLWYADYKIRDEPRPVHRSVASNIAISWTV